jgi:hypothetical protein
MTLRPATAPGVDRNPCVVGAGSRPGTPSASSSSMRTHPAVLLIAMASFACIGPGSERSPRAPQQETPRAERSGEKIGDSDKPITAPPPALGNRIAGGEARSLPQTPRCLEFWPEARYHDYAYDHIVHITNGCRARATCAVSSDVNPTVVEVLVPQGEHVEVLTTRGSQEREFRPRVDCRLFV